MRLLLAVLACVLLGSLAVAAAEPGGAGSGASGVLTPGFCWGGGIILQPPPPGSCWGGGIIPQPPPGFCWGEGAVPIGPGGELIIAGPPVDGSSPGGMAPGLSITPTLGPAGAAGMSVSATVRSELFHSASTASARQSWSTTAKG
jgi:hypothetical protein